MKTDLVKNDHSPEELLKRLFEMKYQLESNLDEDLRFFLKVEEIVRLIDQLMETLLELCGFCSTT